MNAKLLLLVPLPLLAAWMFQDDSEKLRMAKLKAIDSWVGHWKATAELLAPDELKGIMGGELDVKRDLGDTALRFDGWIEASPKTSGSKRLKVTGLVTFNHAANYADQAYTAVFSWSEDGRFATAKGDFKGKELQMAANIGPDKDMPLSVRVVGDNPRKVIISAPATASAPAMDWIVVTLRR